jgi:uncharacterized protein
MENEKFRWVSLILVALMIVIHIAKLNFYSNSEYFILEADKLSQRPWTIFTYMFFHSNLSHLFSNIIALALFGSVLESIIGYKNFLLIFFLSGIFSGLVSVFFYSGVLGASGSIFGIMGALAVIRPKMLVWAINVPMPIILAIVIWILFDTLGTFYPDNIAHFGHISGILIGLIIGFLIRNKYKIKEEKKGKGLTKEQLDKWEQNYMKK